MSWRLDALVTGFPGKTATHGGLGWSSVTLLRDGVRTVLVDCGPPQYVNLLRERLAALGLTPEDITDIFATHLHWDHVSNVTMFPHAKVAVGRSEFEWARLQPAGTFLVPDLHVAWLAADPDRARVVEPGVEFLPGVRAVHTPGHTPGHLAYVVETEDGPVLFAGDAAKNRYELATGDADSSLDFAASRASIELLRSMLADDPRLVMIPGHDLTLRLADGEVVAQGAQRADFQVFADTRGPSPRDIN
jgi:glyoxylase-like metal-dependent hydrolase (beta-lactamase superfamily II)